MNMILYMWGKPQKFKVVFDLFPQEPAANEQTRAFNLFLGEKKRIIPEIEKAVQEDLGVEDALSIITPKSFYVKKTGCEDRVIGIFFENKNDPENDYVVIIKNEKLLKIGNQDDIL